MHAVPSILPLRLDGVGYRAGGVPLLAEVTLAFAAGPRSVVLGPNGAGKSLLLRLCHGLLAPPAGRVLWGGAAPGGGACGGGGAGAGPGPAPGGGSRRCCPSTSRRRASIPRRRAPS